MTSRTRLEKIGSAALSTIIVFLAFKLISEISGSPVEAARGQQAVSQPSSRLSGSANPLRQEINKLASADPSLEIPQLKEYQAPPIPENARDPFDYGVPPPAQISRAGSGGGGVGAVGGGGVGGNAAPAAPQISLQALGYSVRTGVGGEAYLADSDQVYVVHQGDLVSKRYKIVKITPLMVEVQDETSGQTVQLPIPNPQ